MTDLEMKKLCAEALRGDDMSIAIILADGHVQLQWDDGSWTQTTREFDPLHDDAQAMALVKKMSIQIHHHGYAGAKASLTTVIGRLRLDDHPTKITGTDLNRAIVECVAKMQAGQ